VSGGTLPHLRRGGQAGWLFRQDCPETAFARRLMFLLAAWRPVPDGSSGLSELERK